MISFMLKSYLYICKYMYTYMYVCIYMRKEIVVWRYITFYFIFHLKKKTVGLCSHITYAIKKMNMGKDIRT